MKNIVYLSIGTTVKVIESDLSVSQLFTKYPTCYQLRLVALTGIATINIHYRS